MKIQDFKEYKNAQRKISMVTCYDFWSARIINHSQIDCVLVGDSAAMVMHGYPSTLQADTDMMAAHIRSVATGAPSKFIVGDMPFMSFRKDLASGTTAAEKLIRAGAHAVKLEGAKGNLELVRHLVESGIPVMGHLGLTPQSIHQLGGFKVQGRELEEYKEMLKDAKDLQKSGCFALVLECVPGPLATDISKLLAIPTIGIGAGPDTDGQVLVLQDLLGMNKEFQPKFLRKYLDGHDLILAALNEYHKDTQERSFPAESETYL
jgi:3-methyl-2-oxobutanoate hydroxymethyltransferase